MSEVITQGFLEHDIFRVVSETAGELGVRAFVVGGYVRDCFLGRQSKDVDIVVEGSGTALAEAVAGKVRASVSVFKNFGTAMLRYKGIEVEFVGARKESYDRGSGKEIHEDGTLEEDLLRRDFTINAMALSLNADDFGAFIDCFGGIRDLASGIIRTPQDPDMTFGDDPLRMFRAARFATRLASKDCTFSIAQECLDSMRKNASLADSVSKERIIEEINKILLSTKPSAGLRILDETGLLERVLPQLTKLKGTETVEGKGHKENFSHTLEVLDNVALAEEEAIALGLLHDYVTEDDHEVEKVRTQPNLWLRWAALLHDIAKPMTKRYDPALGWTFHGHEVVGARQIPKIFKALKMPLNEKMKYVQKLVGLHLRPIALVTDEVTDSAVRRLLFDAGNDIDDLMLLCNADITSKNPRKVARLRANFELVKAKLVEVEAKDAVRNFKNPITGDYVMELFGIEPCNTIGTLKEAVKNAILDGQIENTFEAADALMRSLAAEMGLFPK